MDNLKIAIYGNPILRAKCDEIVGFGKDEKITSEILSDIGLMFACLAATNGVGLSAPQIGITKRIVLIEPKDNVISQIVMINPMVVSHSNEIINSEEACLSIPGIKSVVQRWSSVAVKFQNIEGEEKIEQFYWPLAQVVQHELDHLNGILFIDRLSTMRKNIINGRLRNVRKYGSKHGWAKLLKEEEKNRIGGNDGN